ncbi:hypothetical protein J3Q64DRAFT_1644969 [Phycomyces blakesleeanus]|uniref:RRM domain-containing protein n=1 Tax=Phycomyces blakesleeanus TaxID=4837 RepID=A0ABR3ATU9_PHYBL
MPPVAPTSNGYYSAISTTTLPVYGPQVVPSSSTSLISTTNGSTQNGEEISTIFVVGFPEDMHEREFQNMFIFSSGFEAATLKVPSKDGEEDQTAIANGNPRKQTIGFAKFRTRQAALEARDTLSGRRVDAEKGSVLKAEMAKKNLHTKRGLSNEQQGQLILAQSLQATQPSQTPPPVPVPAPTNSDSVFAARAQSFENRNPSVADIFAPMPSTSSSRLPAGFNPGHRFSSKSVLDMENDAPFHYLSKSTPLHSSTITKESHLMSPPPNVTSPTTHRVFNMIGSMNPSDQNPPCNTLYVGNLPPNTNEDELKILFSKCSGYKRMSFRNKSNGPMCFVEFDDVQCATQALQDLHGNMLSNSVKGGIRLSFSKNPLVSFIYTYIHIYDLIMDYCFLTIKKMFIRVFVNRTWVMVLTHLLQTA